MEEPPCGKMGIMRNLIIPILIVIKRSHIYSNKTLPQHSTRTCSSTIRFGCITLWSHSTIRCGCSTLRSTLMMIDMNGPDIEAVDEVKALILESANVCKNFKKRVPSSGPGPLRPAWEEKCWFSTLGTWGLVFNDFSKDDFIPEETLEGHGQVASGSASLPDPVVLETVGDRGADTRKRSEWGRSWSTGWVQVWRRNVCRECACGC